MPKDIALKSNRALVKELEEYGAPQATHPSDATTDWKRRRGGEQQWQVEQAKPNT